MCFEKIIVLLLVSIDTHTHMSSMNNKAKEIKIYWYNRKLKEHFYINADASVNDSNVYLGEYKKWHSNGQLKIYCYHDDNNQIHGEYKKWHSNGRLKSYCNFNAGVIHGTSKKWSKCRTLKYAIHYENGKHNGPYKIWHNNGVLYVDTFTKNGFLHGEYKKYDIFGTLLQHLLYEQGEKIVFKFDVH